MVGALNFKVNRITIIISKAEIILIATTTRRTGSVYRTDSCSRLSLFNRPVETEKRKLVLNVWG